jgi:DUF971 family protein
MESASLAFPGLKRSTPRRLHTKNRAHTVDIQPTKLSLVGADQLAIDWSDGRRLVYSFRELRDACPCATCREKRNQPAPLFPVLKPEEARPLKVRGMQPVGHYAYSIEFSDGHDTGIYTFDLLRRLGQEKGKASAGDP